MCSIYNPICDIGKVVGYVGGHVAGSVFNEVAKSFADAAAAVTEWMWTVIANTTEVRLNGDWFHSTLGITTALAGVVVLGIFILELIKGILQRDGRVLCRASVGVGTGVLGAVASIGVLEALLAATDALSDGVVHTAGLGSLEKLGSEIAPAGAIAGIAQPALILILGLGYLIASFFVWAMFVIRSALIGIAAVFAPVAFSGAAARATSGWVRKWIEFTLAMVFAKLVVVIIFTLAISLVGSPGSGMAAVGALFSGLAMMVIACFTPWMLLKLVHFIGGDVIAAHHQSVHQSVAAAGSNATGLARASALKIAGLVGGASTPAAAGRGAAGPNRGAAAPAAAGRGASAPAAASGVAITAPAARNVNTGTTSLRTGKPWANNPVIKDLGGPDAGGTATPPGGPTPRGPRPRGPAPGTSAPGSAVT